MKIFERRMEERILHKAQELFFRYGLKAITMDEVAKELGMSKKTLYEHFKNKNEIIIKVTEAYLTHQNIEHQNCTQNAKDAVEELILLMGSLHRIFDNFDVRIINEMQRYYPDAWNIWLEFKENTIMKDIKDNLTKGIKQGLFRQNINIDIIARMRLEQIQLAMDTRYFPSDMYNLAEVNAQLLEQYINGLCTENGHQLKQKYIDKLNSY